MVGLSTSLVCNWCSRSKPMPIVGLSSLSLRSASCDMAHTMAHLCADRARANEEGRPRLCGDGDRVAGSELATKLLGGHSSPRFRDWQDVPD